MKKILLTVFALTLFNATFAQFNKGRMLIGGSVGFSSTTDKSKASGATVTNYTTTTFSLSPSVAYFVIDNLAVGGQLSLSSSNEKGSASSYTDKRNDFTISPLVRYYFVKSLFGQATLGIGNYKNDYTSGGSTSTSKGAVSQWSLGVGYAILLNDNVAIEPILSYSSVTSKPDGSTVKEINSGIVLGVGVQAYIGKRD